MIDLTSPRMHLARAPRWCRVLGPRSIRLLLIAGLGLAGCATRTPVPLGEERRSEAPKAIEVVNVTRSLTLHFAADDMTPSPARGGEISIDALLAVGDVGEGDQARIERGVGVLADARARAFAAQLRHAGLTVEIIEVPRTPEHGLHIVITHLAAVVRGCPDWSDKTGDGPSNALPRDYGCAVAGDLAAMVANPNDLVRGRRLAPQVGDPALYAMRRYRYGDPSSPGATAPVNIIAPTTSNATAPPPPQSVTPPPTAGAAPASSGVPPAGAGAAVTAASLGATPAKPS